MAVLAVTQDDRGDRVEKVTRSLWWAPRHQFLLLLAVRPVARVGIDSCLWMLRGHAQQAEILGRAWQVSDLEDVKPRDFAISLRLVDVDRPVVGLVEVADDALGEVDLVKREAVDLHGSDHLSNRLQIATEPTTQLSCGLPAARTTGDRFC